MCCSNVGISAFFFFSLLFFRSFVAFANAMERESRDHSLSLGEESTKRCIGNGDSNGNSRRYAEIVRTTPAALAAMLLKRG